MYYLANIPVSGELYHHGIKGQKWGVRRFENADGTLTPEGKERYYKLSSRKEKRLAKSIERGMKYRSGANGEPKTIPGQVAFGTFKAGVIAAAGISLKASMAAMSISNPVVFAGITAVDAITAAGVGAVSVSTIRRAKDMKNARKASINAAREKNNRPKETVHYIRM